MSDKYLCIACEQSGTSSSEVELTPQGTCPNCGSVAVIPLSKTEDILRVLTGVIENKKTKSPPAVFAGVKAQQSSVETINQARQRRIDSLAESYKSIRRFLGRNKFIELDLWWDGFGATLDYSVQPNDSDSEPGEGELEWLTLTLKNGDGSKKTLRFLFDPEDESMREV